MILLKFKPAIFLFVLSITCIHCRGRTIAEPMPKISQIESTTFLVFTSKPEHHHKAPRIHFVEYPNSKASELDFSKEVSYKDLITQKNIIYQTNLIAKNGNFAPLISEIEKKKNFVHYHIQSRLSLNKKYILRSTYGNTIVVDLNHQTETTIQKNLFDCKWLNEKKIICLSGEYGKYREIVTIDLNSKNREVIHEVTTPESIEYMELTDKNSILFLTTHEKLKKIFFIDPNIKNLKEIGRVENMFVRKLISLSNKKFALVGSHKNHDPSKMEPYNVYISDDFGIHQGGKFILNLQAKDSPGFIFGDGYKGVESAAFSPDGSKLAVLMSGENDCKMVDEGGNISCRHDIYILDKNSTELKRLTKFQIDSASNLFWCEFQ